MIEPTEEPENQRIHNHLDNALNQLFGSCLTVVLFLGLNKTNSEHSDNQRNTDAVADGENWCSMNREQEPVIILQEDKTVEQNAEGQKD